MSTILECIKTVGKGERGRKPLTFDQANKVMGEYLDGQIDDDQMAMLFMLIRVQNETHDEIGGFVTAFQQRITNIQTDYDWPCYAGKRPSAGKPWHLIAAKIMAENGHRVLLHGYKEKESDREHAETYLDAMQVSRALNVEHAQHLLDQHNIAYLPLACFAPKAIQMLEWKNRYGLRTPTNTVVRALNPGKAKYGIRGSFHPGFQQLHAEIEQSVGQSSHSVVSFKGQSGESEYNPKVSQTLWRSDSCGVSSHYWPENMLETIKVASICPLGTEPESGHLMANSVIATMAVALFCQTNDRDAAFDKAIEYWNRWVD